MKPSNLCTILVLIHMGVWAGCSKPPNPGTNDHSPAQDNSLNSIAIDAPGSVTSISQTFDPENLEFDGKKLFPTSIGEFEVSPSFSALDARTYAVLQIIGGKNQSIVLNLSPSIRLPAELKVACQRIGADEVTDNLFYTEITSDNENWQRASLTKPISGIASFHDGPDQYSELFYTIPAGTTKMRFVGNTVANKEYSQLAGIAIKELAFESIQQ